MDVKFINTTSSKISGLAVTNGQLIALSDKPQLSYDLGGVRKSITFSDNYTSSAGTAASGVGASSYALATAYNELSSALATVQNNLFQGNHSLCWATGGKDAFVNWTLSNTIAQYKLIRICACWYSNVRGVIELTPLSFRALQTHIRVSFYNDPSATEYIYVQYIDDTTVAVKTNFDNVRCYISGIL